MGYLHEWWHNIVLFFPADQPRYALANVIGNINEQEFGIAHLLANITRSNDGTRISAALYEIPPSIGKLIPVLQLCEETLNEICIFFHFLALKWRSYLESFLMEDKVSFIIYNQCHGCWWLGDARGQDISSNGINLVCLHFSSFSAKKVKHQCCTTSLKCFKGH